MADKELQATIESFPKTFKINRYHRMKRTEDIHRISPRKSFIGSDGTHWLVLQWQIRADDDLAAMGPGQYAIGDWTDLCRVSADELRSIIR